MTAALPGYVVFVSASPPAIVLAKLGAESATPGGGVGGWTSVPRPGREDGSEWGSLPTDTLDIPILFDGLAGRHSMEAPIAALKALGRPPKGSPRGTTPPVLRVAGMVPHENRDWVIGDIEWGASLWDGVSRIRQWAVVKLTAFEPLDVIKITKKKTATATRTYTVKRGDTLGSIARDQMGAKTGSAIAKGVATLKRLNKIRDAKSIKPGMKLKVPR